MARPSVNGIRRRSSSVWKWVIGLLGIALVASVGGYFIYKELRKDAYPSAEVLNDEPTREHGRRFARGTRMPRAHPREAEEPREDKQHRQEQKADQGQPPRREQPSQPEMRREQQQEGNPQAEEPVDSFDFEDGDPIDEASREWLKQEQADSNANEQARATQESDREEMARQMKRATEKSDKFLKEQEEVLKEASEKRSAEKKAEEQRKEDEAQKKASEKRSAEKKAEEQSKKEEAQKKASEKRSAEKKAEEQSKKEEARRTRVNLTRDAAMSRQQKKIEEELNRKNAVNGLSGSDQPNDPPEKKEHQQNGTEGTSYDITQDEDVDERTKNWYLKERERELTEEGRTESTLANLSYRQMQLSVSQVEQELKNLYPGAIIENLQLKGVRDPRTGILKNPPSPSLMLKCKFKLFVPIGAVERYIDSYPKYFQPTDTDGKNKSKHPLNSMIYKDAYIRTVTPVNCHVSRNLKFVAKDCITFDLKNVEKLPSDMKYVNVGKTYKYLMPKASGTKICTVKNHDKTIARLHSEAIKYTSIAVEQIHDATLVSLHASDGKSHSILQFISQGKNKPVLVVDNYALLIDFLLNGLMSSSERSV